MTSRVGASFTATSKIFFGQVRSKRTMLERVGFVFANGPVRTSYTQEINDVKVQPSVKKICEKCKVIRRNGRVMVICDNLRHKQRQG